MIVLESSYDGSGTITDNKILMADAEAGAQGEAVIATAGRLTKSAVTSLPQFILIGNTAAGVNVKTNYIRVREDQVWLADIAGVGTVAANAALVLAAIGTQVACLDVTGTKVDSALLTTGKVEIVSVDTVKGKARIKFNV